MAELCDQIQEQLKKTSVTLLTYDGSKISGSTQISTLLTIPYFKAKLDNQFDYIVLSEKSFSYENSKYELSGDIKKYYDYCKTLYMKDGDAITLSKFSSAMLQNLNSKQTWSKQDFL